MTYTRKNRGTCSLSTTVTLKNGVIQAIEVDDGCEGNLKGVCKLLQGRDAREAVALLRGTTCGRKPTSCPDQIAICLQEALIQADDTGNTAV